MKGCFGSRFVWLAGTVACGLLLTTPAARSQLGVAKNFVQVQSSTPGTAQSGHANVSGTMRANQFVGGGAGLTSLTAANLVGDVPSAAIPVPLTLTATSLSPAVLSVSTSFLGIGNTAIKGEATSPTGSTYAVFGLNESISGRAVFGWNRGATGAAYGVYGRSDSVDGKGVFGVANQTTGDGYGVHGQSSAPLGRGVFGHNTSASGIAIGVYGLSDSPSGYGVYGTTVDGFGVYGRASGTTGANYGLYGLTSSADGYGVYGNAPVLGVRGFASNGATGVGVAGRGGLYGVEGELSGSQAGAAAVYGFMTGGGSSNRSAVKGVTDNIDGFGVLADNQGLVNGAGYGIYSYGGIAISGFGFSFGVRGSAGIYGILGEAGRTSAFNAGVLGETNRNDGSGVRGEAGSFIEPGGSFYGVEGIIDRATDRAVVGNSNATTGTPYGVLGDTDSGAGWALYASGNSGASGTKSFRIDHPLDPENRYLLHYSSESPEPMNFYSGNATTGADGYIWVELPAYFSSINRDVRYQLTIVDDNDSAGFVQAKVSKTIRGNKFQIRTSEPNVTVSWRIEAVRNDPWVQRYGAPSEIDKPENERGLFEHPELHNATPDRSFNHDQPARTEALRLQKIERRKVSENEARMKAVRDREVGRAKRASGSTR